MANTLNQKTEHLLNYLQALLPQGLAWSKAPQSNLTKALRALAENLNQITTKAEDFLTECIPLTSQALLHRWENLLGTHTSFWPDATLQQRQGVLAQILHLSPPLSQAFFQQLVKSFGFDATIKTYTEFKAGQALADARLTNGNWNLCWLIELKPQADNPAGLNSFEVGRHTTDARLREWSGIDKITAALQAFKPAHTHLEVKFR